MKKPGQQGCNEGAWNIFDWFRIKVLGCWVALLLSVVKIEAQQPSASPWEITNILSIRRLSFEEAQKHPPARLRGTVVYQNLGIGDFFLNDGTNGVYVAPAPAELLSKLPKNPGALVDLEGFAIAGDFCPSVVANSLEVAGGGELPRAIPTDYFELSSGKMDSQWVSVTGLVVAFHEEGPMSELLIRVQGNTIQTLFPEQPGLSSLRGAVWRMARIRAVASGIFSRRRGLTAPRLFCQGPAFVEPLDDGSLDPKQGRPVDLAELFKFNPDGGWDRGVKIEGYVTAVLGPKKFLLQDGSGALETRLMTEAKLEPGQKVAVVGFPESERFFPRFVDAQLVSVREGGLPPAAPCSIQQILEGEKLGERVRIEAVVRGKGFSLTTGGPRFDLQDLGVPAAVHFPPWIKESSIPVGAKLRIDAAHILEEDVLGKTSRLFLFPASESDVVILHQPRQWINKYMGASAAAAGLLALAVFAWNNQLRRQVQLKTRELVAANETKSVFIRNISHEIRTPLHGIIATADLMARTPMNQEQFDFLRYLQRSAEGLLHLINDILDVAKIESGKLTLDLAPFDLRRTATDVVELLRPTADQKGLEMQFKVAGKLPPWLIGDQFRIRQVLFNLLGNAVKFTDKGMVGLTLDVREALITEAVIQFEIRDSGAGISEESQAKLFKPFSQVDASSKRRFEGSGLGLVICRELVGMMGGEITLKSKVGEGSLFSFTLRFGIAPGQSQPAPGQAPAPLKNFESISVLVAEDNAVNAHLLRVVLQKLGCKHKFAANGVEAVEAVRNERFDLVLMDCQMPVMDGLQAAEAIRELPPGGPNDPKKLPIIALTASASPEHREECLRRGMNGHLSKPFTAGQIEEVLARWANATSGASGALPVESGS